MKHPSDKFYRRALTHGMTGTALYTTLISYSFAASAYGPEGLFGGIASPDNTYTLANPVQSQAEVKPERNETVLQHPRPDYEPLPISIGSFNVLPSLEGGASYDSNVYAAPSNKTSDEIYTLKPSVVAVSNWDRNALAVSALGDFDFYNDNTVSNNRTYVGQVNGRYDIMQQTWLGFSGGYQHVTVPEGSPNNVGGASPTTFDAYSAGISGYRNVGLISTEVKYDFRRLDYGDTPALADAIAPSAETRNEQTVTAKIGYNLTDNLKPYIQSSVNFRDYDEDSARQSTGYDAVVGATADLGGIISTDAYVGWLSQDYKNFGAMDTNDGVKFGGRVQWNVTGLTTVILTADRSVEETPLTGFNSFMATGGSATVTHELLRNVLLEADFAYQRDDFQGTGERRDNVYDAGGGVRWLINRNLYTDLVYNHEDRDSSEPTQPYNKDIVSLRLGMQL